MDTMHYVWKGGHIPRVALWATRLLDIKPVLDIWRGEVRLVARPRTKAKGVLRMLSEMADRVRGGPLHVVAMHADARDEAEALLAQIEARFPCHETLIVPFPPVIGAHTGPGLLAVAFYED
jgi:DegV family protein with EDD domain